MDGRPVILLLSGGVDSTTAGAILRASGYSLHALTMNYGQRHKIELAYANRVSEFLQVVDHKTVNVDLRQFGGSALTDAIDVPKDREALDEIPVTYVPARNTVFLSYALAWAEVIGATDLCIGVNAIDYSGYPDCRPEFIEAFEAMANLGTKAGVEGNKFQIHTPLAHMTKAQIISEGIKLGVDYSQTHSCYDPDSQGRACGHCDSCLIRARAFAELGLSDPVLAHLN